MSPTLGVVWSVLLSLFLFSSLAAGQTNVIFRELVDGDTLRGNLVLSFENSTTRTIGLTPGLSFVFSCTVTGSSEHRMGTVPWTKNGETNIQERSTLNAPEASLVYYYREADHNRMLVFKNYNSTMNANYTCTTSTDAFSVLIREDVLTIVLPILSTTRIHGQTGSINMGVFLAGIPRPSAETNLTWYLNDQELTNELATSLSFTYTWIPAVTLFLLSGFVREMEGHYRAVVTTSAGSSSAEFYLDIESRTSVCLPTIEGCLKEREITVATNATFTINCTDTNGDPLPQFSWTKDSYSLTSANDSVTVFEPAHRVSSLTITNIQPEMAGVYNCFANNRIGKTKADAIVNVKFPPRISPITSLSYAVPIGQPIQLLVEYRGGFPSPMVDWYKLTSNGVEEGILLDTRASLSGQYGLNLTIDNTTLEDDSQYVLYVNNTVGSVVRMVFTVSILVPPQLTIISQLVSYRPVGDCVIFLVNITGAKPLVEDSNLMWVGHYMSQQAVRSFVNNVSNLTLCGLRTADTGLIRLRVSHSSSSELESVFNLTVWNPPSAPSRISAVGSPPQSCVLGLSWSADPPPDTNTARIDDVIIDQRHCRVNTTCSGVQWERVGVFPASNNRTTLYLLPDQEYKFRATSRNHLIGYGHVLVSTQYVSSEVKGFEPRVGSLRIVPVTSSSMNLSFTTPTATTNCYNISTYDIQCNTTGTNRSIATRSIQHSNTPSILTLITGLLPDNSYTCSVTVLVTDISGNVTSLGSLPPTVVGNTAPLPPSRPSLPSVPLENTIPNTIELSLSAFKDTLGPRVSHVRVAVLRLGSSPTIPYDTPDAIDDEDFSTYRDVHNDQVMPRGFYPPYFAAEFPISEIPNEFYIGSDSPSTRKRQQPSIVNGPLNHDDHYTLFLRVYSRSNFGPQYTVYNSTNFIDPIQPVRPRASVTPGPQEGGGAIGVVVGVVILLLVLVLGVVAGGVVGVLLYVKKRKHVSTDLRGPPVTNNYTLADLKNGQVSPDKSPPIRSPPTISPPPVPIAASNPGYDKLELASSIYDKPSLSPDPVEEKETNQVTAAALSDNSSYSESIADFITTETTGEEAGSTPPPPQFTIRSMMHVLRELFQDHLKDLDDNEQEKFKRQFKAISDSSPNHPATASQEEYNFVSGKNRYKDIVAFDHTRVRLQVRPGVPHSDYINANYIKGYHDNQLYIATQGPKEETYVDFWRMIWEQGTVTIVMLCNLMENHKSKCYQYWPNEGQATYGQIVVRVDRNIVLPHYTIRGFKVFHTASLDKERTVLQFHYTAWPDRNVPSQASPLLDFLRAVNSANDSPDYGPMVVHCSAGVGRTGTIIALDIALEQLKAEGKVDVEGIVRFLRHQRRQMVQVLPQYIFIHHAILEDIIYGDSSIVLGSFKDHYSRLQQSDCTLIHDEFNKIGTVKPPAQACSGPNVVHQIIENKDDGSYVAHYLDGYWKPDLYIASPCPTSDNLERFWRMVWRERCTHIIDLSPKDGDTFTYLPPFSNEMVVGSMRVKAGRKEFSTGYVSRIICITSEEEETSELIVNHIQYQDWQMKFLPRADKFAKFIQVCLMEVEKPDRGDHPILIHDDGSNGPVGVFATLSYCFQRAKKERLIDLLQAVNLHYLQCPGLIINLQFYAYCYDCLHEYTDKLTKEESVPPIYENIASFRGKLSPDLKYDENHQAAESLGYDILDL